MPSGWSAVGSSTGAALPEDLDELERRTAAALARGGRVGELGAHVPPEEIDELRIVGTYLASHPETPQLALQSAPERGSCKRSPAAAQSNGSSTTAARWRRHRRTTAEPGGASRRTSASAIGPRRGETRDAPTWPTVRPSKLS